jgi:adenylate cyclase
MSETRKIAAILVADVVGYSRLAGADEDRTLSRLRGLRSDLIDPAIAAHRGRVVKRTGDGALVEFRSVVDAVRCAVEIQHGVAERNAGVAPERRIEFRVGVHLGDVVEEADGDLMGDGVNIASRLEGVAKPGTICLSEQAYWQVKGRLDLAVHDLGPIELKNIAEPIRVYSLEVGAPARGEARTVQCARRIRPAAPLDRRLAACQYRRRPGAGAFRRRGHGEPDNRSFAHSRLVRDRAQHRIHLQGQSCRSEAGRPRPERPLCPRGQRSARWEPHARQRSAH